MARAAKTAAATKTAAANSVAPFGAMLGPTTKGTVALIHRITISVAVATAAAYVDLGVFRRTTAPTSGTKTDITPAALDATASASTCAPRVYTAAPTAGTGGGIVATAMVFGPLLGTPANGAPPTVFDFKDNPIVLRSATDCIELCCLTAPGNAPTVTFAIEYSETQQL